MRIIGIRTPARESVKRGAKFSLLEILIQRIKTRVDLLTDLSTPIESLAILICSTWNKNGTKLKKKI